MKRWWFPLFIIVPSLIFMSMEPGMVPGDSFSQTETETRLRNVGHRFLLSIGDSSSRVLPIEKAEEGIYIIRFENAIGINPDSLTNLFQQSSAGLRAYAVEVRKCQGSEVLYSFVITSRSSESIIPCLGRELPTDCYQLTVRFTPRSSYIIYYIAATTLLLALCLFLFIYRKKKNEKNSLAIEASGTDSSGVIRIGMFSFDPSSQKLESEGRITELTGKESQLLAILARTPNEVVEREQLQKEIWEDEGVIVTRSLDMFISKLRKKLKDDASLSIVNVHGKGYRLEIRD